VLKLYYDSRLDPRTSVILVRIEEQDGKSAMFQLSETANNSYLSLINDACQKNKKKINMAKIRLAIIILR